MTSSEKGIRGSCYGSVNAAIELPCLTQMAAEGQLALGDAVSHITDLDGIEAAFERLRRGEGARTVVIIDADASGDPESPR